MPNGSPPDDPDIPHDEILYRRVTSHQVKWRNGSLERVGKNAFDDSSDGTHCSIHLGSKLDENGLTPESLLAGYEDRCGLARFTAGDARGCGFGVLYSPELPHEPAHGSLTGDKTPSKPRKDLAKKASMVVIPPRR